MGKPRFAEEFKIGSIKQITERGCVKDESPNGQNRVTGLVHDSLMADRRSGRCKKFHKHTNIKGINPSQVMNSKSD